MTSSQPSCVLWAVISLAALSSFVFAYSELSTPYEQLTAYNQADSNFTLIDAQPDFPCTNISRHDNFTDFQIDLTGTPENGTLDDFTMDFNEKVFFPVLGYFGDSIFNLTDTH